MSEPQTKAGKALLDDMQKYHDEWGTLEPDIWRDFVSAHLPAIEAEAWREALRRYGNHVGDCPQKHGYACTCGFARSLLQADEPK